jgi:hypothetical protein
MNSHRFTRPAALGLTVAALAAPTAVAQPLDLRSPDARDAARTGSLAGTTSTPRQDLRSPDTRDYAEGRGTFNAPEVTIVKLAQPAPAPAGDGGIDWGDVGIGAGGALGLALLALGGTFAVVQRRQGARPMATTG